jgi:hypothetical protein
MPCSMPQKRFYTSYVRRNAHAPAQFLAKVLKREMRLHRYLQKVLKKVDEERDAISAELAGILEASSATEIGR